MTLSCDYLILTVTDVETSELFGELQDRYGRSPMPTTGTMDTYNDLGSFGSVVPSRVYHLQCNMGSDTPGGSSVTTLSALIELKPQKVAMVGIAFGVDEGRQKIGQILVSESIKPYDFKKIGTRKILCKLVQQYEFRSKEMHCAPNLQRLFKAVKYARTASGRDTPTIEFGPLLSGQTLIDNLSFRNELLAHLGPAIGGEMEGAGLCAAANFCPTKWIIVKAICDWADGTKHVNKNARQVEAARNAAQLLFDALDTLK